MLDIYGQDIVDINEKIKPVVQGVPPDELPAFLRKKTNLIPDTSNWWPGDLILVSAFSNGSTVSWCIKKIQKQYFKDEHARWHHAAIYIGNNCVCEVTRKGMRCIPIWRYLITHKIRVLRPKEKPGNIPFQRTDSQELVLNALTQFETKYSFRDIFTILSQAFSGNSLSPPNLRSKDHAATICSTLYSSAYAMTIDGLLCKKAAIPSPARLSSLAGTKLMDVPQKGWLEL